ncbi:hypothetical protein K3177_15185 [Qipengyuania sp. GH25]|uniref:DUF6438 domain-containing protein n=1 Tax=Qipengyuania pacifica TaxID=2860199 RepID=A0ABS7JKE4_9SPHN|nr:DUF6438 domain-containing protein [Qipengyuania aerophila]MBX7489850.1 hypothetical protein [Qipengyuania aerophila]
MRFDLRLIAPVFVLTALAGCATAQQQHGPEANQDLSIRIEQGPCFGFCPVYDVTVDGTGKLVFNGKRHTRILGVRTAIINPDTVAKLETELAGVQPKTPGRSETPCDAVPTDTSLLVITWNRPNTDPTILASRIGCDGPAGKQVLKSIDKALKIVGVKDWAQQKTRPGAPRG